MSEQRAIPSQGRTGLRYVPVALTICVGVAASVLGFAMARAWEQQKTRTAFTRGARDRVSMLSRAVEMNLQELESLSGFFAASREVERLEFREFVKPFLLRRPAIQALEWIPRVLDSEREAYEEAARRDGFPDFQITERLSQGRMVRAAQRQEYFPVYYVEPYEGNEAGLGFDLASDPTRLEALNRSRDSGEMVATGRITLVQETGSQYGHLVFLPIYRNGVATDSVEDCRRNLEGFVLGVFRIGEMLERALTYLGPAGIDIWLYDTSAPPSERFLCFHSSRRREAPVTPTGHEAAVPRVGLHHAAILDLPGRKWRAVCTPAPDYVAAGGTWQPWAVLMTGLLFTGLAAGYLRGNLARTANVMAANRRLAEEIAERRRAEAALRDSEERFRTVISASKDAMIAIDEDGLVTLFNPAAEQMFGWSARERLGRPLGCLMPEQYRQQHASYVEGYFTRGEPRGAIGNTVELPAVRSDGQQFPIELSLSIGQCGDRRFAVGIIRDITNRKQAEAKLERAKQAAEAATRAKSEFLANMSHEIRTPMTAILGFADVLLEHGNLDHAPPERIEAAKTIKRNGEYLIRIINDILDLSKIEAGKMVVERIRCSPCRIVGEVASLARVRADAKGLPFEIQYVGPVPETIQSDPTRLRQILINLIGNATKFTERGGIRLVARFVEKDYGSPMMQFDVIDSGIGMTEAQLARLFEPFTQADSSTTRNFGGSGLGLAISKRLAEMLGGGITVTSKPGRGSTFRVTIATGPLEGVRILEDPAEAMVYTVADAKTSDRASSPQAGLDCRILVAEDGPDNQRLISFYLRKAGAAVTVVENGRAAVDTALAAEEKGRPFDVILMDMQMPELDGYQATSLLRNAGYSRSIIALTAHAMEGDRDKCIRAGCDDFVGKPIDRHELLEAIHTRQREAQLARPPVPDVSGMDPPRSSA